MHRLLATAIFAYAGLAAAQFGDAARWIYAPPYALMCGNRISDPFRFMAAVVGPMAMACAVALVVRCVRSRRWPFYAITALFTFVGASACLAYEASILAGYNLPIGRLWWLPWR